MSTLGSDFGTGDYGSTTDLSGLTSDTFHVGDSDGSGYDAFYGGSDSTDSRLSGGNIYAGTLSADYYYDHGLVPTGYKVKTINVYDYNAYGTPLVDSYKVFTPDPDYVPATVVSHTSTPLTSTQAAASLQKADTSLPVVTSQKSAPFSNGSTSSNDAKTTTKATTVATKKAAVAEPTVISHTSTPLTSSQASASLQKANTTLPTVTKQASTPLKARPAAYQQTSGPGRSPTSVAIPGSTGYAELTFARAERTAKINADVMKADPNFAGRLQSIVIQGHTGVPVELQNVPLSRAAGGTNPGDPSRPLARGGGRNPKMPR